MTKEPHVAEKYYAGVYWRGRKESAEACARRAERYLQLVAALDSTWAHWFSKADTLGKSLASRVVPTASTFEMLFAHKEQRLLDGYMMSLWNGEHTGAASQFSDATMTNFSCGHASRFTPNVCVLNPPAPEGSRAGERIATAATMTQLLRAMALAWEPDRGVVMSGPYRDQTWPDKQPPVYVGWVTYLSRRRGTVPPLPAPVRVEPVEDLGTLITLTPERFTVDNPAHVELAQHVRQILDQAGLLGPEQFTSSD
jgi:hypothetical protein